MRPILLLVVGVTLFLIVTAIWAFRLTADLDTGIGRAGTGLGIAGLIILGLMLGFVWLIRRAGRSGRHRE